MKSCLYTLVASPVGDILVAGDDEGLRRIVFQGGAHPMKPPRDWKRDDAAFDEARRQLTAYFAGELREFDLPLAPEGTPFQKAAWAELCRIPYGETRTYGAQAARIGQPNASRAVGAANGRNPLGIVIPCHRVIGASGKLTGYYGGLSIKEALLELERTHARTPVAQATFL
jgi:methylated-DNA-[protein]-cysteine S-methyltransferase